MARSVSINFQAKLDQFNGALNRGAQSARNFGKNLTSAVDGSDYKINRLSHTATAAGAVIAGGFVVAVREAARFEQAMDNVAATGVGSIGKLRDQAIEIGKTTKFTAIQAAEGQEALVKAGLSAADVTGGALVGALNLASAGSLSLGEAAETAAKAMTQFGLAGQAVPHIADLLAAGAAQASGEVHDMAQALNQSGLIANQFGLTIEDTVGSLTAFAKSGLLGSDAGTSFKTMLTRLANPARETQQLMDKLGISAYDTNGAFVGITDLAGQLQEKLGGLTQAQRDQALAQIFGTDAIRAANVLYNEGAIGIQKYIDGVNQFGYAQAAANIKSDNLIGDLQKLKAAVSTLFIENGDGAQSGLRSLVQNLRELVIAAGEVSPATSSFVLGLAATAGGALLAVGGIAKLAVTVVDASQAFQALSTLSPKAAKGLGILGKAAVVATAAFVALQAAALASNLFDDQFTVKSEDAANSLLNIARGTEDVNKGFTGLTGNRFFGDQNDIETNLGGIGDALQRIGDPNLYDKIDMAGDKLFNTQVSSLTKAKEAFRAYDSELVGLLGSGRGEQAAQAFSKISTEALKSGASIDTVVNAFPSYAQAMRDAGEAVGYTFASTQELADAMSGRLPAGLTAAQKGSLEAVQAAQEMSNAFGSAESALLELANAGKLADDSLQQLNNTIFGDANKVQAQKDAFQDLAGAVLAAAEANKTNGSTLDEDTAKGQANIQVQRALRTAAQSAVTAGLANAKSSEDAFKLTKKARDEFINGQLELVGQYGKSGAAADAAKKKAGELADAAGLIPKKVSTEYEVTQKAENAAALSELETALADFPPEVRTEIRAIFDKSGPQAAFDALGKLDRFTAKPKVVAPPKTSEQRAIDSLKAYQKLNITKAFPKITTPSDAAKRRAELTKNALEVLGQVRANPKITVTADTSGAIEAQNSIARVKGKTVRINVITTSSGSRDLSGGTAQAEGGYISGPGTDTSDSIPARLSNGEFVVRAKAVRAFGVEALHRINALGFAEGGLVDGVRRFAKGGLADLRFPGIDFGAIIRLVQAIANPIGNLLKATQNVAAAQKALAAANKSAKPFETKFKKEDRDYDKARAAQDKLRLQNARQLADARERVAKAEKATKTGGKTKAEAAELERARAAQKRVSTENAKESAEATARTKREKTERDKAQKAYDKYADKQKKATDKVKAAQQALIDQQKQLADSIKSISDGIRETYSSKSTDARDWIAIMLEGAKDATKFTGQIAALRKAGLNETLIQDIIGRGPVAGGDIARQLLANKDLIKQLNAASASLQSAADKFGGVAATGKGRYATGGLVTGPGGPTEDRVSIKASPGEWIVPAKAVPDNLGFLSKITYGRSVVDRSFAQRTTQPISSNGGGLGLDMKTLQALINSGGVTIEKLYGGDPYAVGRAITVARRDNLAMSGLSVGVGA